MKVFSRMLIFIEQHYVNYRTVLKIMRIIDVNNSVKMVKIIKFLFFAQKVSSGMGALRPKFLGG